MLRQEGGDNHWNNVPHSAVFQLPEESTLQAIAAAVDVSMGRISEISGRPHPNLKGTTILNFSAKLPATEKNTKEAKLPVSVLVKKMDESSSVELQLYSTLFKDIQPMSANTKNVVQGSLYNLIPRAYLIQKPFIFLENLEHVKAGEFRTSENMLDLDFSHCLLAVETLARFHATSYIYRNQLGEKGKGKLEMLQKYKFLQSSQYSRQKSSHLTPIYEQAFDLAVKVVQQENPSLAFKLQRKVINPGGIFEKVVKLLEEEKYENDDFYVVCHGNFLAKNLLFSYDESQKTPTSCRIINFDSAFFGPLASDLAMFLLTCTSLKFRLEFEEKLLAFYCDAFQEQFVERHGRSSAIAQEFEENIDEFHRNVEKQYKKMMEFAFYNACVLLPVILFTGSTDCTDNDNNNKAMHILEYECTSIKDLLDKSNRGKYFPVDNHKMDSQFEKFVLDDKNCGQRLAEILHQLVKCRVLL